MTESKGLNPRTWNAISLGALLIAIALGLILYWATSDLLNTFSAIILVFGIYMAAASFFRRGREDSFGPSDSDAAMAGGAILAAVGLTGFAWSFTESVLIAVAMLIIIISVVGIALAVKNRSV